MSDGSQMSMEEVKNKRIVAGILALILGSIGVHKFYLGKTTPGLIMLGVAVITCGTIAGVIALIEGIIYLTKSDQEFYDMYIAGDKDWF